MGVQEVLLEAVAVVVASRAVEVLLEAAAAAASVREVGDGIS